MTEFVITLPIFIMIFWGSLFIYRMEDRAVQGHATAFAATMTDAREIQSKFPPASWSITPVSGGVEAMALHNSADKGADRLADLAFDHQGVAGHMYQSWTRLLLAGNPGRMISHPKTKVHRSVNSLFKEKVKPKVGENYFFTQHLNNDMLDPSALSGPSGGGWMGVVNGAITAGGIRPAIGAGMRYGIAHGKVQENYSAGPVDYNVEVDKHVLAPSQPTSKWLALAMVKSELESDPDDKAYSERILAFQMDLNASTPEAGCVSDTASELGKLPSVSAFKNMIGMVKDLASGNIFAACSGGSSSPGGLSDFLGGVPGGGSVPGLPQTNPF